MKNSIYLYYNTLSDGCVILSVYLSVCPFAIETTFPLSNFKTKQIFGILMTLQKCLRLWAPQAPPKRGSEGARNMGHHGCPKFCFLCFSLTATKGGGKWAPMAPFPRRARGILPKTGISRDKSMIILTRSS